jgi:5-(aminomethyl)-3-furanmethanol phosphate kinase
MWVLKLGGSLYRTPELGAWLTALGSATQPLVVVPGGGPFADTVRQAQRDWSLSDVAAHRMAILGMQQMAYLLCDRQARFQCADSIESMENALQAGKVPVWLPDRLLADAADIACAWDVTSDSLAAWLANRLQAEGLVLVKSAELDPLRQSVIQLQRDGVLDGAFHRHAPAAPAWVIQRRHASQLHALLDGQTDDLSGCLLVQNGAVDRPGCAGVLPGVAADRLEFEIFSMTSGDNQ